MLTVENADKAFGGLQALRKVSLKVEEGSITGLIAPMDRARPPSSIPGIGYYSALLILAEIGNINRFPNGQNSALGRVWCLPPTPQEGEPIMAILPNKALAGCVGY